MLELRDYAHAKQPVSKILVDGHHQQNESRRLAECRDLAFDAGRRLSELANDGQQATDRRATWRRLQGRRRLRLNEPLAYPADGLDPPGAPRPRLQKSIPGARTNFFLDWKLATGEVLAEIETLALVPARSNSKSATALLSPAQRPCC